MKYYAEKNPDSRWKSHPFMGWTKGGFVMSFTQDIFPLFKKRQLSFRESYKESEDVYTFIFEKDESLKWKAGQHGIFTISHKRIKRPTRAFSIASADEEKIVKISMRIGENPSEFKQAMLELEKGMSISMRGPIGPLYIKDNSPTLLIAGGIGITPFRAVLKKLEMNNYKDAGHIRLIYIDSKEVYLYKDELDKISKEGKATIIYANNREQLYKEIENFTSGYQNEGRYYMSGSKAMVDSVAKFLKGKDIIKKNIKKDIFIGYK